MALKKMFDTIASLIPTRRFPAGSSYDWMDFDNEYGCFSQSRQPDCNLSVSYYEKEGKWHWTLELGQPTHESGWCDTRDEAKRAAITAYEARRC